MLETLFATLAAKIAAAGIAVAMAATGGLAGTGNLPDRAQTAVSEALSNIGIDVPLGDSAQEALALAEQAAEKALEKAQVAAEIEVEVDEENGDEDGDTGEPNENAAFGQSVAADARDGGVDGREISERARARAEERKAAREANRPDDAGASAGADASVDAGAPADAGSQAEVGLQAANKTPAAGRIPGFVPGGPAGPPAS